MASIIEQVRTDFGGWGATYDVDGLVERIKSELGTRGLTAEGSRIVFSVCPDEINRLHGRRTIEGALAAVYDGDFHLGTLAAYPISGLSGIAAASHHAPDRHIDGACVEGDLIILASPHVGVSPGPKLVYGRVTRPGQEHETTSCGAAMGFLKELKESKSCKSLDLNLDDPLDTARQIVYCQLVKHFGNELDRILEIQDENRQVIELAKINHDLVERTIKNMLHAFMAKDPCGTRFALVSGITINAPGEDFFVLKGISVLKE
ncbi:MAG: hypothetical protein JW839_17875 [Candidatus Lokiarchaeota archaeon]|nr:hypothetical protein [Candidatus Lokiarchaeota archaeon]